MKKKKKINQEYDEVTIKDFVTDDFKIHIEVIQAPSDTAIVRVKVSDIKVDKIDFVDDSDGHFHFWCKTGLRYFEKDPKKKCKKKPIPPREERMKHLKQLPELGGFKQGYIVALEKGHFRAQSRDKMPPIKIRARHTFKNEQFVEYRVETDIPGQWVYSQEKCDYRNERTAICAERRAEKKALSKQKVKEEKKIVKERKRNNEEIYAVAADIDDFKIAPSFDKKVVYCFNGSFANSYMCGRCKDQATCEYTKNKAKAKSKPYKNKNRQE